MKAQNAQKEQLTNLELLMLIAEKLEQLEQKIHECFIKKKDILNSKEAAKYLGIKMSWLDKLCSQNRIKYHTSGKLRYFRIADLDKHKLRNVVKSVDDLEDEVEHDRSFDKKCGLTSKRKY